MVVCTRNRARLLADACEAILHQDYPAALWRLLVVDNASTDDTPAVAVALAGRFPTRVKVLHCPELGHSAARNAAIRYTDAEIIALTDDDALPDAGWLRTLVAVMTEQGALVAGGPVDLLLAGELPPWFLADYLPFLAIWRRVPQVTRLTYSDYPRGVNMAFRREAFERYGLFNRALGLRGKRQLFCEEIEVCLRIERHGGTIVYAPLSRVQHCVEARRFTPEWLQRRFAAQGRSEARLNWMHGGLRELWRGGWALRRNYWPAASASAVGERGVAAGGDVPRAGPPIAVADPESAARLLTRCRRRAVLAYWREVPAAIATVRRYLPPAGHPVPAWRAP